VKRNAAQVEHSTKCLNVFDCCRWLLAVGRSSAFSFLWPKEQTVGSVSQQVSQSVRQAGFFFIILMKSVTWECVALVISSCFACILRWVSELCGRDSDGQSTSPSTDMSAENGPIMKCICLAFLIITHARAHNNILPHSLPPAICN